MRNPKSLYLRDRSTTAICLAMLCLLSAGTHSRCQAIGIRHDRSVALYNALANEFPATGYLGEAGFGQICTATLVAPNKVLTAAHCVDFNANGTPDSPPGRFAFGLQNNVPDSLTFNVGSIAIHPGWNDVTFGDTSADLAVLTLNSPINAVTPARISGANPRGLRGFAVGYGLQGTGFNSPSNVTGANDKLGAENMIDVAGATVEFDFDSPQGNRSSYGNSQPLSLEGGTASGDSGSPLYAEFDGGRRHIVAILSTGFNPFGSDFEYGDISIYAPIRLNENLGWLATQGIVPGTDTGPICDFSGDGNCTLADIDLLYPRLGGSNDTFDLNGDGTVDNHDVTRWLSAASAVDPQGRTFVRGDANLDGSVLGDDFTALAAHFGGPGLWGQGNFIVEAVPGGGGVRGSDFTVLAGTFGFTSVIAPVRSSGPPQLRGTTVPEPGSLCMLVSAIALGLLSRRSRWR